MDILVGLIFWLGLSIAAGLYAQRKGRSSGGWVLFSLLLSPLLGLLFLAILPAVHEEEDWRVPCPYCAEDIRPEAIKCHTAERISARGGFQARATPVIGEMAIAIGILLVAADS